MLNKLKQRKESGFTIIEVLIVLAIAGLIMVMVFIAVPNLQRSQRNTGRRQDASQILSAAESAITNADGNMPSDTSFFDASSMSQFKTLTANSSVATPSATAIVNNDVTLTTLTTSANLPAQTPLPTADAVLVASNGTCSGTSAATYKARAIAVIYTQETSGGYTLACINS